MIQPFLTRMFGIGGWTKIVGGMPITYINFPFSAVIVTQEGSRNLTKWGYWRTVPQSKIEDDKMECSFTYRFFTHRSELEVFLGGIQSAAKNLFFIFLGSLSSRNRKMRELFFMLLKKIFGKIFHSAGGFPNMESTYLAPIPI